MAGSTWNIGGPHDHDSLRGRRRGSAGGNQQVSQNIGGVQEAAAETGRSSANLLTLAQSLSELAGELESRVDRFLGKVRSM